MNRSLMPLAGLYGAGVRLRQKAFQRGWLKSRQLSRPVISVGNVTVGGSGKTPLVAEVTRILLRHDYKPAILTRGYGREREADLVVLEPQQRRSPDSRTTGDEPALLARAFPQVPIVICANRYRAGQLAEERFGVDAHILDDGFQHIALERNMDILAVDVTQGLDGGLLPAGPLREPVSALARADLVVLTRVEIQDPAPVEKQVRQINPRVPIFCCSTGLRGLIELGSERVREPKDYCGKPVSAFCAIGNPSAFFSDLRRWGFHPISEIAFRDHHVYSPEDIQRLNEIAGRKGAVAFLATEKDLMNLPPQPAFDLPVLACAIQAEISDPERFEEVLLAGLARKQLRSRVGTAV
ncbi:MAG: tetraacyldisaccharide 4'-kinase [Acidobacteriota bacterium]